MQAADPTNNTDSTFLQKWFVQKDQHEAEFASYNSVMTKMVDNKVIGDHKKTNFITERWISTMIAIEATAVVAFMTVQSAFLTVAKTILNVLQLDFSGAIATLKTHGLCTILALKVTISMVPLILLGFITPSTAYNTIVTTLTKNIDDAKISAQASEVELADVKEKVAPFTGQSKEAVAKMDIAQLETALTTKQVEFTSKLKALALASGSLENTDHADVITRLEDLVRTEATHTAGFGALDAALCLAADKPNKGLTAAERTEYLTGLQTAREQLAVSVQDVANARLTIEGHGRTITRIEDEKAQLETRNEALVATIAGNKAKVDGFAHMQVQLTEAGQAKDKAVATLASVSTELKEQVRVAKEALTAEQARIAPLGEEHQVQKTEIESLKQEVASTKALLKTARESLATATCGDGDEKLAIQELTDQLAQAAESLAAKDTELKAEIAGMQRTLEEKTLELEVKAKELESLASVFSEYTDKVDEDLSASKKAAETLAETNTLALKGVQGDREEFSARITELEEAARQAVAKARIVAGANLEALQVKEEATAQVAKELAAAKTERDRIIAEKVAAEDTFDILRMADAARAAADIVSGISKAVTDSAALTAELTAAKQDLARLKAEATKAEQEIAKLETSLQTQMRHTGSMVILAEKQLVSQGIFARCQILPRRDKLERSTSITSYTGSAEEDKGTSFTWENGVDGKYIEYINQFASVNGIPTSDVRITGAQEFFDKDGTLDEKIAAGTLSPMATGVPIPNLGWALGENIAYSTVIKNDAGEMLVLEKIFTNERSELITEHFLPTSAKHDHLTAIGSISKLPVFDLDDLSSDDSFILYPEDDIAPMHMDTDIADSSDRTWIGRNAAIVRLDARQIADYISPKNADIEAHHCTFKWIAPDAKDVIIPSGYNAFETKAFAHALSELVLPEVTV